MSSQDSTSVETISNESINIKHITLEKGTKRQYNRKSKIVDNDKELMYKLLEEQELARIKNEQDEFDSQKKEAEDQEFMRHILEDVAQEKLKEKKKKYQNEMDQFLEKLIQIAAQIKEEIVSKTVMERVKNDMINTVNYSKIGQKEGEKNKQQKLSIEETDRTRQNIIDNMLTANVGLVKTAHGGLHAYCNRDGYTLPSNRCVKCIALDNIEIDIFGQMFKYKEHGGMEQKELVQKRVIASLGEILDSWNVDIEISFKEYSDKVNMRELGWQISEEGTIEKMNDELAQACVNGLKNLEIHNYPQLINMEVYLLSVFSGIYGITNEQIRAEGLGNIRKFNKITANAEKNYGQAQSNGERKPNPWILTKILRYYHKDQYEQTIKPLLNQSHQVKKQQKILDYVVINLEA
ncbi:MAG: hypothetical protein EZS28_013790 [Streblomastix strix]|uniref:Uncharacterized protein n=1 Tax=Streblomastix strix TaxID=222440 RepID=A0A5J4W7R0_9EUKA|nr:MAG: hypothetical protein EZS28_013790 [Streblomastix strix]